MKGKVYIFFPLALLFTLVSCKREFLEIVPKGKLIASKTSDYSKFLDALGSLMATETQTYFGDEAAVLEPYFSSVMPTIQRRIRWEDDIYEPDASGEEMSSYMHGLYSLNKVVNEVLGSEGGTENQKLSLQAEAKAIRAWYHFQLINLYGKPYNPATSSEDLGFPIIDDADVTMTNFKRNTVEEVYQFIVKDLEEAIPLLPEQITFRLRMSKPAAEAILGKVFLFMRRFEDARDQLDASLLHLQATTSLPVGLYDYNQTTLPGGAHQSDFFGPASPIDPVHQEALFVRKQLNVSSGQFGNNVVLRPEAAALYHPDDLRFRFFYARGPLGGPPFATANVYRRLGAGEVHIGPFLPDIYLLRAEARARTGDLDGAVEDLENLRRNRMPDAIYQVPAGLTQTALIKFIIDERIREFAITGYRWHDMRRLSVDPLFQGTVHNRVVYNVDGTVKEEFNLRPERLTMRLPLKVILENPGMQNNL